MTTRSFPEGRLGQGVAATLLITVVAIAWLAVGIPLSALYQQGAATLEQRRAILARVESLATALPGLRASAAAGPISPRSAPAMTLGGATDALAGATLQTLVGQVAVSAGVTVSSVDTVSPQNSRWGRRIGIALRVSGSYRALVTFVAHLLLTQPKLVIDDLELHDAGGTAGDPDQSLDGSLTVYGFRTVGSGL